VESLDRTFTPTAQVRTTIADGEAVVLDLATQQFFGMNRVGTRIWTSLEAGHSLGEVITLLRSEYQVDAERIRTDVETFVGRLLEYEMLENRPIE
jgi:hypothetical protein